MRQVLEWWVQLNVREQVAAAIITGVFVLLAAAFTISGNVMIAWIQSRTKGQLLQTNQTMTVTNSPGSNTAQFNGPVTVQASPVERLDESKIALGLRYAYEFDGYLGATNRLGNENRKFDPTVPLRKPYSPNEACRFVFSVINENAGLPLGGVSLQILFLDRGLKVTESKGWDAQRTNEHYSFRFLSPINNIPQNAEAIVIVFPHPGIYSLRYMIDGSGIRTIEGSIPVELY